jgi:hypothetical protein
MLFTEIITIYSENNTKFRNILSRISECDYSRGLDMRMDLLITCTHHSESQTITTLSLISTHYNSPQQPLRIFQPDVF